MIDLDRQMRDFVARKNADQAHAAQLVALQLCCGLDLAAILSSDLSARRLGLRRLERMMERERLKGQRKHWSYDLNRHIALGQAAMMLRESCQGTVPVKADACATATDDLAAKANGARRRRKA